MWNVLVDKPTKEYWKLFGKLDQKYHAMEFCALHTKVTTDMFHNVGISW